MPIIYEFEKNKEKDPVTKQEVEVDFDIKAINIISENEAMLIAHNSKIALDLNKTLKFFCKMSRLDGGKDKLNFEVSAITKDLNTATNLLKVTGDLVQALGFIKKSYISERTQQEALTVLGKFSKEEMKENCNDISPK